MVFLALASLGAVASVVHLAVRNPLRSAENSSGFITVSLLRVVSRAVLPRVASRAHGWEERWRAGPAERAQLPRSPRRECDGGGDVRGRGGSVSSAGGAGPGW